MEYKNTVSTNTLNGDLRAINRLLQEHSTGFYHGTDISFLEFTFELNLGGSTGINEMMEG